MLALLSPAKRLDFVTPPTVAMWTTPAMLSETGKLIKTARNLSQKKMRELMDISPKLAKLNSDLSTRERKLQARRQEQAQFERVLKIEGLAVVPEHLNGFYPR